MDFNPQAKMVLRLENWTIASHENGGYVLFGEIYDDPDFQNGDFIRTNYLISVDFRSKVAETTTCFYKLGNSKTFNLRPGSFTFPIG